MPKRSPTFRGVRSRSWRSGIRTRGASLEQLRAWLRPRASPVALSSPTTSLQAGAHRRSPTRSVIRRDLSRVRPARVIGGSAAWRALEAELHLLVPIRVVARCSSRSKHRRCRRRSHLVDHGRALTASVNRRRPDRYNRVRLTLSLRLGRMADRTAAVRSACGTRHRGMGRVRDGRDELAQRGSPGGSDFRSKRMYAVPSNRRDGLYETDNGGGTCTAERGDGDPSPTRPDRTRRRPTVTVDPRVCAWTALTRAGRSRTPSPSPRPKEVAIEADRVMPSRGHRLVILAKEGDLGHREQRCQVQHTASSARESADYASGHIFTRTKKRSRSTDEGIAGRRGQAPGKQRPSSLPLPAR